jgi:hypothetical protein
MIASKKDRNLLAAAGAPFHLKEQAVIIDGYSRMIASIRQLLLSQGLADKGTYCEEIGSNNGRLAYGIHYPGYIADLKTRVGDTDVYGILVSQSQVNGNMENTSR